MKNRLSRLIKDDSGATAIEYGMIAGLIAVVIVGVLATMGPKLAAAFQSVSDKLPAVGG